MIFLDFKFSILTPRGRLPALIARITEEKFCTFQPDGTEKNTCINIMNRCGLERNLPAYQDIWG